MITIWNMMRPIRKLRIGFKRLFEAWINADTVRAEVQAARAKAPRIALGVPLCPPTKRVGETQLEWQTRRDGK